MVVYDCFSFPSYIGFCDSCMLKYNILVVRNTLLYKHCLCNGILNQKIQCWIDGEFMLKISNLKSFLVAIYHFSWTKLIKIYLVHYWNMNSISMQVILISARQVLLCKLWLCISYKACLCLNMKSYPTWFIMMWRKIPCFEFFTINLVGYFEAILIHEANILI